MGLRANPAFTLAELLIALAILGLIATFTIPKILAAQESKANLSKAKEVVAMVSEAYHAYLRANNYNIPTNADGSYFTSYMNYVNRDTASSVDLRPNVGGAVDCSAAAWVCLRLHNGGTLMFHDYGFGGTSSTNAINFGFDPDSKYSGSSATNAPGQGVEFWLYYNGKIRTSVTMENPTAREGGNAYVGPGNDPSWFTWE